MWFFYQCIVIFILLLSQIVHFSYQIYQFFAPFCFLFVQHPSLHREFAMLHFIKYYAIINI